MEMPPPLPLTGTPPCKNTPPALFEALPPAPPRSDTSPPSPDRPPLPPRSAIAPPLDAPEPGKPTRYAVPANVAPSVTWGDELGPAVGLNVHAACPASAPALLYWICVSEPPGVAAAPSAA